MPQDMASITSVLKEVYESGGIEDQLNNDTVGLRRIERTSDGVSRDVGGRYTVFPLRVGRNHGIGARAESEVLPSSGQQRYNSGRITLKYEYGAAQITGQVFELADKDFQAFAAMADREISGLKSDLMKDQNRQFYGDGSGAVAVVGTATGPLATATVVSVKYLEVGMLLDLIDGTTLANTTPTVKNTTYNLYVSAINPTTKVVTFTQNTAAGSPAAITTVVGDILVRVKSANREFTGLAKIVNNAGILYNLDPATETYWKGIVDANGGTLRPLSEGLLIFDVDQVRANGAKTSAMFSGLGVRRAYFELLVQQRRFTNTQTFEGGFSGLAFTTDQGDIPFVVDVDCPDNTIYGIDESQIKLYRDSEWQFMDRDGSMWQRVINSVGRFDAYECMMFMYCEIGTHQRNAHFVMKDVTEG